MCAMDPSITWSSVVSPAMWTRMRLVGARTRTGTTMSEAYTRPGSRAGTRSGTRPQLGDHLHHVGHGHLAGAHGLEAFGQGPVGVLLDVQLRLDGHRSPAAGGVDGDLLKFRTTPGRAERARALGG